MVKLSILDQSPIVEGHTPADAIRETIRLAKAVDAMGYHRYWVAEHHNTSSFAGSAPEIMIGKLASETSRIRVGSGGVMLSHYSAFKVAELFRVLETLYPGRIDLGIGRAPGGDPQTHVALQAGPQRFDLSFYPTQVEMLRQFLTNEKIEQNPFRDVDAMPLGDSIPEMWMLGSGTDSAVYAGQLGYPYSFAHFIGADNMDRSLSIYREHFQPSRHCPTPRVSIGVFALCGDSDEDALHLAKTRDLWAVKSRKGQGGPFSPPNDTDSYPFTTDDHEIIAAAHRRGMVGSPDKVRDEIMALAERTGAEEVFVVTITHDYDARLRSYELLAEAFALS